MRVGLIVSVAFLIAQSAQAAPLRLFDVPLLPPSADISTGPFAPAPPPTQGPAWDPAPLRLAGWSLLEGVASIGTGAVMVIAPPLIVSSLARTSSLQEGLGLLVIGGLAGNIIAPFVTSLVVWGIDGAVPGSASYGRVLLFSAIARAATLGIAFAFAAASHDQFAPLIGGVLLTPVTGAIAEVVAARTAPAPSLPAVAGVPLVTAAF